MLTKDEISGEGVRVSKCFIAQNFSTTIVVTQLSLINL